MKKYIVGDPFPEDFWNYDVNVITGYKVERKEVNSKSVEEKYRQTTQGI
jgi:hypothetical protein